MIKFLFLDLDDTILDFGAAEHAAIIETLRAVGVEPSEKNLKRYGEINRSCWQSMERGELQRDEVLTRRFEIFFSELGIGASPKDTQNFYAHRLSLEHPFMEGAPELLEQLFGKYKMYIASNGIAIVQDRRISDTGISKYFDGIFISERIGYNKPAREFFDACFGAIRGFDPSLAMIVGDSLTSDILGGINAGIATCWINPKHLPGREDIRPDYELEGLHQLEALLETL
jgi:2-haloacid dehalogenase